MQTWARLREQQRGRSSSGDLSGVCCGEQDWCKVFAMLVVVVVPVLSACRDSLPGPCVLINTVGSARSTCGRAAGDRAHVSYVDGHAAASFCFTYTAGSSHVQLVSSICNEMCLGFPMCTCLSFGCDVALRTCSVWRGNLETGTHPCRVHQALYLLFPRRGWWYPRGGCKNSHSALLH